MGYFVSPPKRIEGGFFAIFAQTNDADSLAVGFLESRGIEARQLPVAEFSNAVFRGVFSSLEPWYTRAYVCVPESQIAEAIQALESDSGLVD
jgi:hypothetical protein